MKIRKITTTLFAVSCMISMETAVFANEPTPDNNAAQIKATYSTETQTPEVYYVDIQWGSLEYTYNSGIIKSWDTETLKFTEQIGKSGWSRENGADTITVTNHSNMGVMASFSYEEKDSSGISGTFSRASGYLAAPEENSETQSAPSLSTELTLTGTLPETAADKTVVGTVNVTISGGIVYYCQSVSLPGGAYIYTTDTPGIYRSTYTASETRDVNFSFRVGKYNYGAGAQGRLNKSGYAGVGVTGIAVTSGHTYEFICDINKLTYTCTDITAAP